MGINTGGVSAGPADILTDPWLISKQESMHRPLCGCHARLLEGGSQPVLPGATQHCWRGDVALEALWGVRLILEPAVLQGRFTFGELFQGSGVLRAAGWENGPIRVVHLTP